MHILDAWLRSFLAAGLVSAFLLPMPQSSAHEPGATMVAIDIVWQNLQPHLPPPSDPLSHLTQDQRFDLETIAWVRELSDDEKKLGINKQGINDARKFERQFKALNIDVERLLQKYRQRQEELTKRQSRTNPFIDGHLVKILGYLIEIQTKPGEPKAVFLAPIGGCGHGDELEINQTILVKLPRAQSIKALLPHAYYATGIIKIIEAKPYPIPQEYRCGETAKPAYELKNPVLSRYRPEKNSAH